MVNVSSHLVLQVNNPSDVMWIGHVKRQWSAVKFHTCKDTNTISLCLDILRHLIVNLFCISIEQWREMFYRLEIIWRIFLILMWISLPPQQINTIFAIFSLKPLQTIIFFNKKHTLLCRHTTVCYKKKNNTNKKKL